MIRRGALSVIGFISIILVTATSDLKALSVDCSGKEQAIVVQGLLPKYLNGGFIRTAEELVYDLSTRGYSMKYLIQPSWSDLRRLITKNPCLKAFGFVGEGVEEDSTTPDFSDNQGADILFLSESEGVISRDMYEWTKDLNLEVVILHACHQGSSNNLIRWRNAFRLGRSSYLKAWSFNVNAVDTYLWQYFWK